MRMLLVVALFAAFGCTVDKAVGPGMTLPKERATECADHCASLDMRLSAVVVIMNKAGCVCEPRTASGGPGTASTAAVGAATIQAVMQQQQQQQQDRSAAPHSPSPASAGR
jgi:hypothetical protein